MSPSVSERIFGGASAGGLAASAAFCLFEKYRPTRRAANRTTATNKPRNRILSSPAYRLLSQTITPPTITISGSKNWLTVCTIGTARALN